MSVEDVVVIGAGVAGLAATGRLRAAGVATTLIEAGGRIGGRAYTSAIGGEPFDRGASWLHAAARNPLVAMATQADGLRDSDGREERVFVEGRPATAAERDAYHATWDRLDDVAGPALRKPDTTLAEAMRPLDDDPATAPWTRLIGQWEGAIIAAADADLLGLRDWGRNRLEGANMVTPDGIGAYVIRRLGTAVELHTAAGRIGWSGPGVTVETPRGTLQAGAVIVTVSTGVLTSGAIAFDPPLPEEVETAIVALPMGLLSKVALPALGADRMGVPPGALLVGREQRMTFNAWHLGRAHVTGFVGGRLAWKVARDRAAAEALARAELAAMLGGAALAALGPAAVVTAWGTDPLFRGAYAYAGPGDAGARGVLGGAFPGERLVFAGEAVRMDGLAGTVGGAYLSGVEAADRLLAMRRPVRSAPAA